MSDTPSLGKLKPEEFVLKAIERLRVPPYKGIHSVYSGFNGAFREYFPLLDPVDLTNQLANDGKIVIRPVRGGVMLYKTEDISPGTSIEDTTKQIVQELTDITPEEFVLKAIERLRVPPYKGIHTVYSGFNGAFRGYFPLLDPVDFTNQLANDGKIVIRPVRGGVTLYKTEDVSPGVPIEDTIKQIVQELTDITPEEFVLKAIERLRVPPYKGIHSVYSGFNGAFREYFPLLDPVDFTNQLADDGKVVIRPVRGGVMLYKTEEIS